MRSFPTESSVSEDFWQPYSPSQSSNTFIEEEDATWLRSKMVQSSYGQTLSVGFTALNEFLTIKFLTSLYFQILHKGLPSQQWKSHINLQKQGWILWNKRWVSHLQVYSMRLLYLIKINRMGITSCWRGYTIILPSHFIVNYQFRHCSS